MKLYMEFPHIISNTDVGIFSCKQKWFKERCLRLVPIKREYNENLSAGSAFAKGLEVARLEYLSNGNQDKAIAIGHNWILDNMEEDEEETDTSWLGSVGGKKPNYKTPIRMAQLINEYFRVFPFDMHNAPIPLKIDGKSGIEHSITAELPINHPESGKPLVFKGKFDMLAKSEIGTLAIYDDKTAKMLTKNDQAIYSIDGQFAGYSWLCEQEGYGHINDVRIRRCAILKNEYKIREYPILVSPLMVERWFRTLLYNLYQTIEIYNAVKLKNDINFAAYAYGTPCSTYFTPCNFVKLCNTELNSSNILDHFKQETWNPANRTVIPLEESSYAVELIL